jgi:hypothetical protein
MVGSGWTGLGGGARRTGAGLSVHAIHLQRPSRVMRTPSTHTDRNQGLGKAAPFGHTNKYEPATTKGCAHRRGTDAQTHRQLGYVSSSSATAVGGSGSGTTASGRGRSWRRRDRSDRLARSGWGSQTAASVAPRFSMRYARINSPRISYSLSSHGPSPTRVSYRTRSSTTLPHRNDVAYVSLRTTRPRLCVTSNGSSTQYQ